MDFFEREIKIPNSKNKIITEFYVDSTPSRRSTVSFNYFERSCRGNEERGKKGGCREVYAKDAYTAPEELDFSPGNEFQRPSQEQYFAEKAPAVGNEESWLTSVLITRNHPRGRWCAQRSGNGEEAAEMLKFRRMEFHTVWEGKRERCASCIPLIWKIQLDAVVAILVVGGGNSASWCFKSRDGVTGGCKLGTFDDQKYFWARVNNYISTTEHFPRVICS